MRENKILFWLLTTGVTTLLTSMTTVDKGMAFCGTVHSAATTSQSAFLQSSRHSNLLHRAFNGKSRRPSTTAAAFSGNASWYGAKFNGRRTASGKRFDMSKLFCAHRSLPFGTKILVENPKNGKSVVVEVVDRGPFSRHRVMDVSQAAAKRLGMLMSGVAFVDCTVLQH